MILVSKRQPDRPVWLSHQRKTVLAAEFFWRCDASVQCAADEAGVAMGSPSSTGWLEAGQLPAGPNHQLMSAWRVSWRRLQAAAHPWIVVAGPMAALQTYLMEMAL